MNKFTKISGKATLVLIVVAVMGFAAYELFRNTLLREGNLRNVVFWMAFYALLLGIVALAVFIMALLINLIKKNKK